ncbi:MAG TPA: VOC family protein [Acidimicrobiia bacterium]|nr:VOC family protein [Acidimicrobiia bacterium]
MIPVRRLNHAVLYVRDAQRAAAFYGEVLGFRPVAEYPGAAFLRAEGSANHHDLGLFSVGPNAPGPEPGRVGLYHLAWQVDSVTDLATARDTLQRAGAYSGESDHGATKSIYGHDPDGNEFEIMWMLPRDEWGEHEHDAPVGRLDLDAEIARHG